MTLSCQLSDPVFEPAQLPQETICPSVDFAKGQIGNSRGQSIIYYNINRTWRYFHTLTTSVHSTILSGNCEVSNSEVERHFPPHEIRFLLLCQWFYPFHVENNSRFSSWTLFQRHIDVYIKQRRSLRSTNETSCQHFQIPLKPVTHEWCKSHSTSKYGESDPHMSIAFELLSLQDGRVCNNSANNYKHYLVERQDFITILQSYLEKHFGICYVRVLWK